MKILSNCDTQCRKRSMLKLWLWTVTIDFDSCPPCSLYQSFKNNPGTEFPSIIPSANKILMNDFWSYGFVKTINQLADIFKKPLDEKSLVRILAGLGMIEGNSVPGLGSKDWYNEHGG